MACWRLSWQQQLNHPSPPPPLPQGERGENRCLPTTFECTLQGLTATDFYKSMTINTDHRVWQDVYHAEWQGIALYVKFQQAGEYFVISFKER